MIGREVAPAAFARQSLEALEASEGRRKKRKRDTTPDRIGLDLKREILQRMVDEAPEPQAVEAWLLGVTLASQTPGPARAMCGEIMDEYRVAMASPEYRDWLAHGAPSDDR